MGLFSSSKANNIGEMSFLQHLEALRWHLVRSVLVISVLALVAFCYIDKITDGVLLAPTTPHFLTYRALCHIGRMFKMGDDFCVSHIPMKIINTEVAGQFNIAMWIAFVAGLIIAFPYIIWELWRFVKPALQEKEKKYARGIVFYTSFLFLSGVLFGYFIITPMSINFLTNFQVSLLVENFITLDSVISIVTTLTLVTGLVFELPIVIYFLSKLGIITPKFMRKYRRHAVVVILIAAAIITPTSDATTMIFVSMPLYMLYEVSIFVSAKVLKRKKSLK